MAKGHIDINAEISVRRESDDVFTIESNDKGTKIRVRAEDSKECDMWIETIRSCVYEMQRCYIQEKAKSSVYNPDVVSMVAMEGLKQLVQSRGGTQNVSESMLRRKLVKSFGQKTYKEFFGSSLNFDTMLAEIDKGQLRICTWCISSSFGVHPHIYHKKFSLEQTSRSSCSNTPHIKSNTATKEKHEEEEAIKSKQKLQIENLNEMDRKIVRDVFWMVVSVLEQPTYDMRGLFVTGMPRLELCLFTFERLLHIKERALGEHLTALKDEIQVPIYPTCRLYATQWFMTFFARDFPLELSLHVWDIFLLEGWPIVFKIAIALMKRSARHIQNLDFETSLQYLQHDLPRRIDVNQIMCMARSIEVSDCDLSMIELEFENRPKDDERKRRR